MEGSQQMLRSVQYRHEYNAQKAEVEVSALSSGLCFLKVNGVDVTKFVKQ